MSVVALSELLGASVRDASGAVRGRVHEIAVAPQDHPTRIAFLIVKTSSGDALDCRGRLRPPLSRLLFASCYRAYGSSSIRLAISRSLRYLSAQRGSDRRLF